MTLTENHNTWNEEDLIYAAGYLDGEGCFTIQQNKIHVICETTHRPTIEWLHKMFGGSFQVLDKKPKAHHRITYRWFAPCHAALRVCQHLAPYLKEKQEQALLLIAFQQTMGMRLRGGKCVDPEIIEHRKWFENRIKECKGRVKKS